MLCKEWVPEPLVAPLAPEDVLPEPPVIERCAAAGPGAIWPRLRARCTWLTGRRPHASPPPLTPAAAAACAGLTAST